MVLLRRPEGAHRLAGDGVGIVHDRGPHVRVGAGEHGPRDADVLLRHIPEFCRPGQIAFDHAEAVVEILQCADRLFRAPAMDVGVDEALAFRDQVIDIDAGFFEFGAELPAAEKRAPDERDHVFLDPAAEGTAFGVQRSRLLEFEVISEREFRVVEVPASGGEDGLAAGMCFDPPTQFVQIFPQGGGRLFPVIAFQKNIDEFFHVAVEIHHELRPDENVEIVEGLRHDDVPFVLDEKSHGPQLFEEFEIGLDGVQQHLRAGRIEVSAAHVPVVADGNMRTDGGPVRQGLETVAVYGVRQRAEGVGLGKFIRNGDDDVFRRTGDLRHLADCRVGGDLDQDIRIFLRNGVGDEVDVAQEKAAF